MEHEQVVPQAEVGHEGLQVMQEGLAQDFGLAPPPNIPSRERLFQLSEDEQRRALELKSAVESSQELEKMPDLHYIQFILAFPDDDLEEILDHVRGIQAFRQEYNIQDTLVDGMLIMTNMMREHPNCVLSVAYDEGEERYGLIFDRTRVDYRKICSDDDWRILLGFGYYIMNILCPDPLSMRNGIFVVVECEGSPRHRMSINNMRQVLTHLLYHMPIRYHRIKCFHTNVVTNLFYSMLKPFMRRDVKRRMDMGCDFGINLGAIYLQPMPEIATIRTLGQIDEYLMQRYENEATFTLNRDDQAGLA